VPGIPKTLRLALFGPWPIGMGSPSHAVLRIINDDPAPEHNPLNPLALPRQPRGSNPLAGARFFVDHDAGAALSAAEFPHYRRQLGVIASQPNTQRFGTFSGPDVGVAVSKFLTRAAAEEPGTVPMISTYRLVDHHCGNYTPSRGSVGSYLHFIRRFAQGISDYRAVLFLEMD
jgi:hypothetical protein